MGLVVTVENMTLSDVLMGSGGLDVACRTPACGVNTRVDAAFFARRRGVDTALKALAPALNCAVCGGPVTLGCAATHVS